MYVACLFKAGQDTTTTADGTTIFIPAGAPSKNAVRVNNGSELGADCGDLRFLVDGKTKVSFGRRGVVATEVCAPESKISLGHNNILIGSFVADTISADLNNFGRCCGGTCACFDQLAPTVGVGRHGRHRHRQLSRRDGDRRPRLRLLGDGRVARHRARCGSRCRPLAVGHVRRRVRQPRRLVPGRADADRELRRVLAAAADGVALVGARRRSPRPAARKPRGVTRARRTAAGRRAPRRGRTSSSDVARARRGTRGSPAPCTALTVQCRLGGGFC